MEGKQIKISGLNGLYFGLSPKEKGMFLGSKWFSNGYIITG
jgi:hypothetical protein